MRELLEVMRRLRAPTGCPWDREQTHRSLRRYLLEEAAEAVDALTAGEAAAIVDELGDVLVQVAFHAVIAEEEGRFDYRDIERAIVDKLVRRHPHVFGDRRVSGADEVVRNWQAIKDAERGEGERSAAERVPRALPALTRAAKLGEALGWRADSAELSARLAGLERDPSGFGDFLLAAAQVARDLGVEPELALREALEARAGAERGTSG